MSEGVQLDCGCRAAFIADPQTGQLGMAVQSPQFHTVVMPCQASNIPKVLEMLRADAMAAFYGEERDRATREETPE